MCPSCGATLTRIIILSQQTEIFLLEMCWHFKLLKFVVPKSTKPPIPKLCFSSKEKSWKGDLVGSKNPSNSIESAWNKSNSSLLTQLRVMFSFVKCCKLVLYPVQYSSLFPHCKALTVKMYTCFCWRLLQKKLCEIQNFKRLVHIFTIQNMSS